MMADLLIKCPETDKPLPAGLGMHPDEFAQFNLTNISVGCPHCGDVHVWNKQDAWIAA